MQGYDIGKGRILFDERDNEVLKRRKKWVRYKVRAVTVVWFGPLILLLLFLFGIVEFEENVHFYPAILLAGSVLGACVGVMAILISLNDEYILLYENGIELFRFNGLRYRSEFHPIDSILRIYTQLINNKGEVHEDMIMELEPIKKRRGRWLHDNDFVDKEKFLNLVAKNIEVTFEPVKGRELLKGLSFWS